jgi:2-isopropylmalate synthase
MEIYDCTLREGEQAEGASFSLEDRLNLCRLLDDFRVDYIELGLPLANEEINRAFKIALKELKNAKIVAFGSTSRRDNPEEDENLNSIVETGVKYACIFGKSDLEQVEKQLRISKEENLEKIKNSVRYLKNRGLVVFYDAEHYFDGFKKNRDYALETLLKAIEGGAEKIILCDTNGGILANEAREIVETTREFLNSKGLNTELGVHFHDDCGLALANTLICLPYIKQVQGTINGIGERAGNLNFTEFLPIYMLKLGREFRADLKKLKQVNEQSFRLCGIPIPDRRAFVGNNAFSHVGGVHIDAEAKGASYSHINPEEVGNKSKIVLNSLGGRSCVVEVARQLGFELDKKNPDIREKINRLFDELREYERAGYKLGSLPAEQYLLINKYFGKNNRLFEIKSWKSESERDIKGKEISSFYSLCDVDKELIDDKITVEGGPVDAAFNTLKEILSAKYPEVNKLHLLDFRIGIASWREEKSTVRTEIFFRNGETFSCVGVDSNMIGASLEALSKGIRYHLLRRAGWF